MTSQGPKAPPAPASGAEQEVARLCSELIRIDTSNAGDDAGPGERVAAEYVAEKLADVGLEPTVVEPAPHRTSVVTRLAGTDPGRDALLIHCHLDVVPAVAADWTVHPFSGEVRDGFVWGRGALDMKNMCAITLAVVRQRLREGRRPSRDVVVAFVADEEHSGALGAGHLVLRRPELLDGCSEAIGEGGGFSVHAARSDGTPVRLYPVGTAQRGTAWLRLAAHGTAGHGSRRNRDNAVTRLAAALARIGAHDWPVRLTQPVRDFLREAGSALGVEADLADLAESTGDADAVLARLGPAAVLAEQVLRHSANPTMLDAGYKVNVIPGTAAGHLDGRVLPGYEDEFLAEIDRLSGPGITREFVSRQPAVDAPYSGPVVSAIRTALAAEDPGARPVPFCSTGGNDGKWFARLGMAAYGFAPLRLTPGLDYSAMFHGVDERINVDALRFGVRVLDRILAAA
jgi:acetylornithine deacetylase/succinyl-diaminopimelate desuccinylase-like protein